MNVMFGITNIKIKVFSEIYAANDFLEEHNGDIIDIQCKPMGYNDCIYIIYQEK